MWDFGILNLRNNKPSEQWTPISDEWPFGTMNLYFGTMNFRNNEPSEELTLISDKWPFGTINLRHNKPFFRNNEPSEQWTFGTMNLRKNGPSEKRTVTVCICLKLWQCIHRTHLHVGVLSSWKKWYGWVKPQLGFLCVCCFVCFYTCFKKWDIRDLANPSFSQILGFFKLDKTP